MTKYKYPYIPKELFAPVMFACKMVRENGYLNQACQRAADYYGVSFDDVMRHVRARASAGQKGKKKGTYKFYTACKITLTGDEGCPSYSDPCIKRAVRKWNVGKGTYESFDNRMEGCAALSWRICPIGEYATKEEAIANLESDFKSVKLHGLRI